MAINSNSKEARRAVEAYVMDNIADIEDNAGEDFGHRPVAAAFEILSDEMAYQDVMRGGRRIMGAGLAASYRAARRSGFTEARDPYWVWYLAGCVGHFEVYTDSTRHLIAEWLQETPEEAARYSSDEVELLYLHLTASAFERLYDRENELRKISTSDFRALYKERNGGYFFDRDTMRYYHQTMRDIEVYGFELVTGDDGIVHDCYRVESWQRTDYDEKRKHVVSYFDRDTLKHVFKREEARA